MVSGFLKRFSKSLTIKLSVERINERMDHLIDATGGH